MFFFDPVALRVVASRHPSKQRKIRNKYGDWERVKISLLSLIYLIGKYSEFSRNNNDKIVKISEFVKNF